MSREADIGLRRRGRALSQKFRVNVEVAAQKKHFQVSGSVLRHTQPTRQVTNHHYIKIVVQYSTVQYSTVQYSTVQYSTERLKQQTAVAHGVR